MIFQWRLSDKSHGILAHVIGLENLAAELSTQDQRWPIQIAYRISIIPVSTELKAEKILHTEYNWRGQASVV